MSALHLLGLVPLLGGAAMVVFAERYGGAMITHLERVLLLMRRPGFVWVYRSYGFIFALSGVLILFISE